VNFTFIADWRSGRSRQTRQRAWRDPSDYSGLQDGAHGQRERDFVRKL